MTGAIQRSGIRHIKLHVSGDFFSTAYIAAWTVIARRLPDVVFWIYTRAWRVADFLPALTDLSACPNVQLWFSHDTTSGEPPLIEGVRRAFLSYYDEPSPVPSDLVFRASLERKGGSRQRLEGFSYALIKAARKSIRPIAFRVVTACLTERIRSDQKVYRNRLFPPSTARV